MAYRVDGPVEVHPGFPDFDVRLVDFPRVVACFQMRPRAFVEFWGKVLDPAIDGRVIDMQSPFLHHLFQVAIAERIPQIPAHAEQNDLGFEMTPFEQAWIAHARNSSVVLEIKQSLPEHPRFCNTTSLLHRWPPQARLR